MSEVSDTYVKNTRHKLRMWNLEAGCCLLQPARAECWISIWNHEPDGRVTSSMRAGHTVPHARTAERPHTQQTEAPTSHVVSHECPLITHTNYTHRADSLIRIRILHNHKRKVLCDETRAQKHGKLSVVLELG